jgi:hypothetical protein
MFSRLRSGLIYKNISSSIVEHDLDIDVHQWSYDSKDVYRGSIDPEYISESLNVYWLYNDDSMRIGLAEHEADDAAVFETLWFYENPYATLFQDLSWTSSDQTLWSRLSNEAYQDCLEDDFKSVHDLALNSGTILITPAMLINKPNLYTCTTCNKKSLVKTNSCSTVEVTSLDFNQFNKLFIDEDFVLYTKTSRQHDACDQEQSKEQAVQQEPIPQPESPQELEQVLPQEDPPQYLQP